MFFIIWIPIYAETSVAHFNQQKTSAQSSSEFRVFPLLAREFDNDWTGTHANNKKQVANKLNGYNMTHTEIDILLISLILFNDV